MPPDVLKSLFDDTCEEVEGYEGGAAEQLWTDAAYVITTLVITIIRRYFITPALGIVGQQIC